MVLKGIKEEIAKAEEYYLHLLKFDADDAYTLTSYPRLLEMFRRDMRAVRADPGYAYGLCQYGAGSRRVCSPKQSGPHNSSASAI